MDAISAFSDLRPRKYIDRMNDERERSCASANSLASAYSSGDKRIGVAIEPFIFGAREMGAILACLVDVIRYHYESLGVTRY